MDKFRVHDDGTKTKTPQLRPVEAGEMETSAEKSQKDLLKLSDEELHEFRLVRDRAVKKKRWGYVLLVLGVVTILDSLAAFPIPLVRAPAMVLGFVLMIVGGVISAEPPRMRETNEAILIGMKYANHLTVARLAVEMDISLKRAEKIIAQLVKNGIAEIELDADDPHGGITYRLKGV